MTIRYVGPGGSDSENGLSWGTRKLTLTGAEDTPVEAGDTIYVGPGVYREILVLDVSGTIGLPITYIADVTGINTDGVGGVVRITGNNNDLSPGNARNIAINAQVTSRNYRTFRGFYLEEAGGTTGSGNPYALARFQDGSKYIVFEDCVFGEVTGLGGMYCSAVCFTPDDPGTTTNNVIRRCINISVSVMMEGYGGTAIDKSMAGCGAQNCISIRGDKDISTFETYGWVSRHITFINSHISNPPAYTLGLGTATSSIYDSLFVNGNNAIGDDYVENYNSYMGVPNEGGANSLQTYIVPVPPMLLAGYRFPYDPFLYTDWNPDIFANTTSGYTEDVFGISRPTRTNRGAVQFRGVQRDSDISKTGLSSLRMDDASRHRITIPVEAGGTYKATVFVRRDVDYTGTLPQIMIDSPGQTAVTITDTGAVGEWSKLTAVITVGDKDRFVQIELRSNNTASSGDVSVWFDDIAVKGLGAKIPTSKWITNELLVHAFGLDLLDPWISPSVIVPTIGPVGHVAPMPTFYGA